MSCCGKMICSGCRHANEVQSSQNVEPVCPLCRASTPDNDEWIDQIHKRAELNDGEAYFQLGTMCYYGKEELNVTEDEAKGIEYCLRVG
jgi:hypothetical protein